MPDRARVRHLVRRTVVSVRGRDVSATDEVWARAHLSPAEQALWVRQDETDRAHAVEVARSAAAQWGSDDTEVVAAALLHDVGKLDADLGVGGRVAATLVGPLVPRRWWPRLGRLGRHLDYPERGAAMLAAAGSASFVVEWARQHHWRPSARTVDPARAAVLAAADDAAG